MEDIDLFIKRLQEEQEVKDFLERNIYPKSLSKYTANPYKIEKFPELKESKALRYNIELLIILIILIILIQLFRIRLKN
jgi:hypothetical protein